MDIHVEMHLSYETDVWAYGMVTLENIIRFPVQLRKFKNKDTGEETSFLSYPRRERCGKWENIPADSSSPAPVSAWPPSPGSLRSSW